MGYSVKAKKKVAIQQPSLTTAKNGRKMVQGTCPETGCKVCVFVKDDFTGEGLMDGIIDFVKPLASKALEKAKEKALEAAKKKAAEIAGELAGKVVTKVGDKIKEKVKGKGKGAKGCGVGKLSGIDSVPHRDQVKTMFYGPLGGEGLYLPGSMESKTGYNVKPSKRPVGTSVVAPAPAPAPAQVATAITPQQKMGGDGSRKRGKGLF
jgi:hypothetical protein